MLLAHKIELRPTVAQTDYLALSITHILNGRAAAAIW